MELNPLKNAYEENRNQAVEDFFTFLQFESISSEPGPEMRSCADWVLKYLQGMGLQAEIWETGFHPVVFGQYHAGDDRPTLLIYHHYDVQPVDPLEEWKSPPFEPTIRGGEVYARGAQDNKGQCFYTLFALKLLMEKEGALPINVKLFIEGGEEIGSLGADKVLAEKQQELAADYLAIVDGGIPAPDRPAVILGVRGIATLELELEGSSSDLHSGAHGGLAYNPLHALAEMIAGLRDDSGKVLVPGFYDDVKELTDEERSRVSLHFDEKEYREMFDASASGGESAYPPGERVSVRPTLEVNGLWGGYTGDGFKTVIPAKAHAKISCRLVPDQKPDELVKKVKAHLEASAPPGIRVKVSLHPGSGEAARASIDSKVVKAFAAAYEEIFQKPSEFVFEGGSIPIIPELAKASGAEAVVVGFGLPDDHIHAPNEHFGLDRIEKGVLLIGRVLEHLR